MRYIFVAFLLLNSIVVAAQVEIFRGDEDTSTYIRPEDTITIAPKFETGDQDFLRYIETHVTILNISSSLTYLGGNYKFSFYIEKDGSLTDFKMLTFTDANIAHELERVVNRMPKWNPGKFQGKKKRTLMIYDVNIRRIDDFNSIEVTMRDSSLEYTRSTNPLKWAIVVSSVLVLVALYIIRG